MRLADILFGQGFGTRRACAARVRAGQVVVGGRRQDDPGVDLPVEGLVLEVDGAVWPYRPRAVLLLHKPAGYECSQKPRHHPSVMSLLPEPLRTRGVQPVGRLDADTTGLLVLTDDGALIHRLTSPRHHVPKVYEVGTAEPVTDRQLAALVAGVVLHDDPAPVSAAEAVATGTHALRVTLRQGKYHQVKRMVAAVGNAVTTLHRSRFGALALPADLAPGSWRWAEPADTVALESASP